MKPNLNHQVLKKLTLIIGILVAIVAGLHTTAQAHIGIRDTDPGVTIEHQEMVSLLAYLWENDFNTDVPMVTVYNYDFELMFQGPAQEINDPQLLVEGDVLMTDGNHTIYMVHN